MENYVSAFLEQKLVASGSLAEVAQILKRDFDSNAVFLIFQKHCEIHLLLTLLKINLLVFRRFFAGYMGYGCSLFIFNCRMDGT